MTATPYTWTRRTSVGTAVWVLAVTALAWAWLATANGHSPGGHAGAAHHGGHTEGPLVSVTEAQLFLAMWAGMVVAMMLPVAMPLIAAHRFVTRGRPDSGAGSTAVFIGGYLLAWVLSGLVPLLLMAGKRWLLPLPSSSPWAVAGIGLVVTGAGFFQFSGLKTRCLTVCRNPLTFVLTHDFTSTRLGTLRAGALNGLYCLGCCWALMLVQVAVGIHNLVWMGALTLLFLAERALRTGATVARVTGGVMVALGVPLICEPMIHTPLAGWVA